MRVCVFVRVCFFVCVCVRVSTCMSPYVCVNTHIHTQIHIHAHSHTRPYTCCRGSDTTMTVWSNTYMLLCVWVYVYSLHTNNIHTKNDQMCTNIHRFARMHMFHTSSKKCDVCWERILYVSKIRNMEYAFVYTHIHTYTHTYIYIHTYIHIHMYI